MRMRAAVLEAAGQPLEVRETTLDPPRRREVLVRVGATGLCGSDLNVLDGKRSLVPFPAVLGHEAAGTVEEVGPEVDGVRPGDRVVVSILSACGECPACVAGRPNHCERAAAAMSDGTLLDGTRRLRSGGRPLNHFLTVSSLAEYAVVPASAVTVVDPAIPLDRAALLGCAVLTGIGAVRRTARVKPGERVAVFGCGGVGLSVIQGARIAGASSIVAVDAQPEKLALAAAVGATETVAASADASAAVRECSGGGVEHAFEAAGRAEAVAGAWASLAPGGQLTVIGLLATGAKLTLEAGPLIEEKRIAGCYLGSSVPGRDVPELVSLYLDGRLLLDELITRRLGLEELDDAFARMRAGVEARQVVLTNTGGGVLT